MQGNLNLITPPDIFENDSVSVLFIHLSDVDQEAVSKWLAASDIDHSMNFYVYSGEPDVVWLLHAINRCDHKFIDLSSVNYVTQLMTGYMLGNNSFCYKTADEEIAEVCGHLNNNRIFQIEQFLERIVSDQAK